MTTRITVTTDSGGLLDRNAQQQAAARQAALLKAQAEKAAANGETQLRQDRINAGLDPATGRPLPSTGSTLRRVDQQPAAFRRTEVSFPFALGWQRFSPGTSGTLTLVSGDGSTGTQFSFPSVSTSATTQFEGSFTRYDSPSSWTFVLNNNPFLSTLTPFPTNFWVRTSRLSTVEFSQLFQQDFQDNRTLPLPLSDKAFVYATLRRAKTFIQDYLLSCGLSPGEIPTTAFSVREEVEGSSGDDPDVLFADPDSVKRIQFVIDRTLTVSDSNQETIENNISTAHLIGKSSLKEIPVPAGLSTRVAELWGTPPSEPDSFQVFIPAFTNYFVSSTLINGVQYAETSIRLVNSDQEPTGMTFRDQFASFEGITSPDQAAVWEFTPMPAFGLAVISPTFAEFLNSTAVGATPLAYRILDDSNTLVEDDFYSGGSAFVLADTLTALSPLPSKFMWIDVTVEDTEGSERYLYAPSNTFEFKTYKSDPLNARTGGTWRNFKKEATEEDPTELPSTPGSPATLKATTAASLYPAPDEPFAMSLIFTTPYGDTAYCKSKLIELGFSTADLTL